MLPGLFYNNTQAEQRNAQSQPEEIRRTFSITNDFSPDEEDQIRQENEWADDRRVYKKQQQRRRLRVVHLVLFDALSAMYSTVHCCVTFDV